MYASDPFAVRLKALLKRYCCIFHDTSTSLRSSRTDLKSYPQGNLLPLQLFYPQEKKH
jgi:hypothetical protein